MNIDNLFYLKDYNPNFIHDFYQHLKLDNTFKVSNMHNDKSDYVFSMCCVIDDKNAFEIFNMNIDELTIDTMNKICVNNFSDLMLIRKLKQKIVNESEYDPLFGAAKLHFHYDIINRVPILEILFNLHLNK